MKKLKVMSMVVFAALVVVIAGSFSSSAAPTAPAPKQIKIYQGLGQNSSFRVGPGVDANNVQIYTFTTVTATATFDKSGKILNVNFDSLEVSTPNYEGESMPHFSGWPGTTGYNVADHATGKITGVSDNTNESTAAEIDGWKTKRDRGATYGMNPKNDWYKQANSYQNFFKGKTVAEIEKWFAKNCSDVNGKPLTPASAKDGDQAKFAKLTAAEKTKLADVVSGATMSLKDVHGDFLKALEKAYTNRVEVTVPVQ
jgi:hypothetical protein